MADKSFQLSKPACPDCHSKKSRIHWRHLGNVWRLPAAGLAGLVFPNGLGPKVILVCSSCQASFRAQLPEHLTTDQPPVI